ncbi:hypothetical protein Thein_1729 [Thermodesulfatator indicus DSM 15286]|uniref:Uncharacterized protein n=1 Tax=Thermodesulfatator indicus (strain DSM 15286 / JCM 11887 / CIR29812) TaxID=667014 RepID=F8ABJ0_THEID|nr:hypothetical protein Thein_1729 [Thermodesulfatator indicus DSM 15286]
MKAFFTLQNIIARQRSYYGEVILSLLINKVPRRGHYKMARRTDKVAQLCYYEEVCRAGEVIYETASSRIRAPCSDGWGSLLVVTEWRRLLSVTSRGLSLRAAPFILSLRGCVSSRSNPCREATQSPWRSLIQETASLHSQ